MTVERMLLRPHSTILHRWVWGIPPLQWIPVHQQASARQWALLFLYSKYVGALPLIRGKCKSSPCLPRTEKYRLVKAIDTGACVARQTSIQHRWPTLMYPSPSAVPAIWQEVQIMSHKLHSKGAFNFSWLPWDEGITNLAVFWQLAWSLLMLSTPPSSHLATSHARSAFYLQGIHAPLAFLIAR